MPVGRIEYLHLGPMTFEEFLLATEESLLEYIYDFDFNKNIPGTAHARLLERQREFLFVGGMPEAVLRFVETKSLKEAESVHQSIIETYKDDFSKYVRQSQLMRLHRVFNYVPASVGRKIKYSNISGEEKSRELKTAIDMLTKAGLVTPVYHSSCSGIPLSAQVNYNIYKLLFVDVGLMNRICGLDWLALGSMDDRNLVNEGSIAEQFIGQHLLYMISEQKTPKLHYWLREKKTSNAEVDYVLSRGKMIFPVEVKAGKSGSLKSLFQFAHDKNAEIAVRFDLNLPSVQRISIKLPQHHKSEDVSLTLISLPLYMVGQLNSIIEEFRRKKDS
ncbi:AAA+ family ATPase [candidate division KSB1 bacterium]|nr:MAG: AAA+ family ATPase [candidate division KSB1 bacterium]